MESTQIQKETGKYSAYYVEDCIDYMERCKDKRFDLGFTDTTWGHDYHKKAKKPMGINKKAKKNDRVPYDDTWKPEFHQRWFPEFQRVTNAQIVCVGKLHINWWVKEFDPIGMVPVVYRNGQGSTPISRYSGHMMYLCFGDSKWWKHHKLHRDCVEQNVTREHFKDNLVYETYIHNGFLRDNKDEFKNPSPKDFDTWCRMIQDLAKEIPIKSMYDPFAGSFCLGEVGEALGIPTVGTDIEPKYAGDAHYRIKEGMRKYTYYHTKEYKLTDIPGRIRHANV